MCGATLTRCIVCRLNRRMLAILCVCISKSMRNVPNECLLACRRRRVKSGRGRCWLVVRMRFRHRQCHERLAGLLCRMRDRHRQSEKLHARLLSRLRLQRGLCPRPLASALLRGRRLLRCHGHRELYKLLYLSRCDDRVLGGQRLNRTRQREQAYHVVRSHTSVFCSTGGAGAAAALARKNALVTGMHLRNTYKVIYTYSRCSVNARTEDDTCDAREAFEAQRGPRPHGP